MSQAAVAPISATVVRPHAVKRNVLATWFAHAIALGVGFLLMPYVLTVLGQHQYGTWVFINSFVAYTGVLYLGLGETISRYVAKYEAEGRPERINEIVSLVLAIYVGTGTLALAIAALLCALVPSFGRWDGHELLQVQIVILMLGVNLMLSLCGSVFGGVLVGLRRFDLERGVSLAFDFVRFGLIFLLLGERWGLVTIAGVYLFITLCEQISFVVLVFRCYPALRFHPAYLKWSVLRECSGFSGMSLVNSFAATVINATDSIVIGFCLGTNAIVPYYVALRLTQFIRQPIEKIAHICMPTAGALAAGSDPQRLLKFLTKALGVVTLLIGGMFVGGWFFGDDLIEAWIGDDFSESHAILCVLLATQVVALPCGILRSFLFGTGNVRVPALIYLLEAACNLGLSILLCQWWGVIGVAWGTAIPAVIIELGLLAPYALKTLGLSVRRLWTQALATQLVPLTLLAAYSWFVSQQPWSHAGWPSLIGITLGGGAVLGAAWLGQERLRVTRS